MKPDWENAPAWANYCAMDADGSWWWFKSKPQYREFGMVWFSQDDEQYELMEEKINWTDSLQERPKTL